MASSATGAALLVDLGSIHEQLSIWRHHGDFKDAGRLLHAFSTQPEAWLGAVDGTPSDPDRPHLSRFEQRVLILPSVKLRDVSSRDDDYMDAVDRFDRLGFRMAISTSSPSLQVSVELLRMQASRGLPQQIVIATAAPDVAGLLPGLRAAGARTGVVAVMTRRDTESLYELADKVLDLAGLVQTFGFRFGRGFAIPNGSHRRAIEDEIDGILSRGSRGRVVKVDDLLFELRSSLSSSGTGAVESLPEQADGLRALIDEFMNGQQPASGTKLASEWRLAQDQLVSVDALKEVATTIVEVARRTPGERDGARARFRLADILNNLHQSAVTRDPESRKWLGFSTYEGMLRQVQSVAGADSGLDLSEDGFLLLDAEAVNSIGEPQDERSSDIGTEQLSDDLQDVADFVMERLKAAGSAVTLVSLANEIPRRFRDVAPPNWLGHPTFLALLREAEERVSDGEWVIETGIPPGYIRLPDHPTPRPDRPPGDVPKPEPGPEPASRIRRYIPDFPNADVASLQLSIAIASSVLATSPPAKIHLQRLNISKEIHQQAAAAGLKGGRGGYSRLLASARIEGSEPRQIKIGDRQFWVDPGDVRTALTAVSLLVGGDGLPGGADMLHRVIAASLERFIRDSPGGEASKAHELIVELLGPYDAPADDRLDGRSAGGLRLLPPATTDDVRAAYRRFQTDNPHFVHDHVKRLGDLARALAEDRREYLNEPKPLADDLRRACRDALSEYLTLVFSDRTRILIDQVFYGFRSSQHDFADIDRSTFLSVLFEVVDQRRQDSRDEGRPWALNLDFPPGEIGVGEALPVTTENDEMKKSSALRQSMSFVRDHLVGRGLAVGWAEAVWVMTNPE